MAGSAGDEGKGGTAVEAGPGIGGMGDGGLMAEVDDANAGPRGGGKDFVEMIADEGEPGVEAQLCARLHEHRRSVWHRNAMLLHSKL